MKRRTIYHLAALAALVWVYGWCQYRRGEGDALLRAAGDSTDTRVARLVTDQVMREAVWRRTEKVITRDLDAARQRADSLTRALASRVVVIRGDSLIPKAAVDSALAAKDNVIGSLARDTLFMQSKILAYRDSVVPGLQGSIRELTGQRDSWRKKSARRFTCGVGPGLTVSLGRRSLGGATVACVVRL